MKLKNEKGSITIFVLVGLLFMSAFLIISYASNVNKSKIVEEQLNIMDSLYMKNDNIVDSYEEAYSALRKKNVRTFSFLNEADADKTIFKNTNTVELAKTFEEKMSNYRIHGCMGGLGDLVENTDNSNYGKYKIQVKVNEKNYIKEEKFYTTNSKVEEYEDYYSVTTKINTGGICWNIEGDFKVGDKINAQAKILFANKESESIQDSITLRIWNVTKEKWINSGANGIERNYSTIVMNEQKTLKFSEVELKSENYSEGDTIRFLISRGKGSEVQNTVNFYVYKDTINFEKSTDSQSVASLLSETHNIFLDNQLFEGDYIDFKSGKVIRVDGTEEDIDLPEISTFEDYTKIEVLTEQVPSKIEVEYVGYTF